MNIGTLFVELGLKKDKFDQGMKDAGDAPKKLTPQFSELGGAIAGAFSIAAITAFTKAVIDQTAEFQKYKAVLTNTLGSTGEAQKSMQMITDIASKTPFSVNELTESYVKLVNQGFKPTQQEIIKLGDLSASTGKSFDQLTEAIIDATTGQFERLKEFGIKASKTGDNVAFSFKGVTTEVAYTNDAIREYMLSLGDLQGVSGSMAAISETLGGKISNLGDTWDQFLIHLGDNNNSTISMVISGLNKLIEAMDYTFNAGSNKDYWANAGAEIEANAKKFLAEFSKMSDDVPSFNYDSIIEAGNKLEAQRKKAAEEALKAYQKESDAIRELIELQEKLNDAFKNYTDKLWDERNNFSSDRNASNQDAMNSAFLTYSNGLVGPEDEQYVNDIPFNTEAIANQVEAAAAKVKQKYEDFIDEMNTMTEQFTEDFVGTFADGLADLITGDTTLKGFFNSILGAFGSFLQQMGAAILAYGISMKAFKEAIKNPWAAIAAGAALIVVGGVISNLAAKGPETNSIGMAGGGSSGSGGMSGHAQGTYGYYNDKYNGQQLVATVDGQKLKIMLESVDRTSARQGRL